MENIIISRVSLLFLRSTITSISWSRGSTHFMPRSSSNYTSYFYNLNNLEMEKSKYFTRTRSRLSTRSFLPKSPSQITGSTKSCTIAEDQDTATKQEKSCQSQKNSRRSSNSSRSSTSTSEDFEITSSNYSSNITRRNRSNNNGIQVVSSDINHKKQKIKLKRQHIKIETESCSKNENKFGKNIYPGKKSTIKENDKSSISKFRSNIESSLHSAYDTKSGYSYPKNELKYGIGVDDAKRRRRPY